MTDNDTRLKPRSTFVLAVYLLVLLWAGAATLTWGGSVREIRRLPGVVEWPARLLTLAAALTTWPAHELLIELEGHGFGANQHSSVSVPSALAFLAWCTILWSPLLALRWRRLPVWLGAVVQAAMLSIVFALFWKYGNG